MTHTVPRPKNIPQLSWLKARRCTLTNCMCVRKQREIPGMCQTQGMKERYAAQGVPWHKGDFQLLTAPESLAGGHSHEG